MTSKKEINETYHDTLIFGLMQKKINNVILSNVFLDLFVLL